MVKVISHKRLTSLGYPHIIFLRIDPEDISITIRDIIEHFQDISWINRFDEDYIKLSFSARTTRTVENLKTRLESGSQDTITTEVGETVVSELSRSAIISELGHSDIPLAEFIKQKIAGNPGFDFFSEMNGKYIIFGEAKYVKDTNAYGKAMKQVDKFITEERDKSDLLDIRDFVTKESLNNAALGSRAFACGFSSTKIDDDTLISNITKNKYFQTLSQHIEVIYIAINTF
ncbi:hypothetical protein [Streptococcus suis]|uniref:hypothetical protein n=1 Tax=Streptococcus suis TaxID=1307 RepID=UPI000CF5925B|nr:hypothetical protein [Streptococcus suis]MBS8101441.1 hypothetical protein [Streptococcus suis]MCK3871979.1 hypothetical protein [Streptococcus suis]NQK25201.1 hypothetical protein [Streptococcus suis]NQL18474.1 hypothetical protein [Streptococcus suis]HEM4147894.1 hypothetical protein [Streptococcus suis]